MNKRRSQPADSPAPDPVPNKGEPKNPVPAGERPSSAPRGVPVEPSPTFSQKLMRMLPRVALLLVIFAIVGLFRAVLLPFALAIFLAYLLFPIIAFLEKRHLGSWRPPRWLAVITVYAALFFLGWKTVPRVAVNLAGEMGQLKDAVPSLFGRVGQWQRDLNTRTVELLAVQALPPATVSLMQNDLVALQRGELKSFELLPLSPEDVPAVAEATPGENPPRQMSLFNFTLNVHLPDNEEGDTSETNESDNAGIDATLGDDESDSDSSVDRAVEEPQEPAESSDFLAPSEDEAEPVLRFSDEAMQAVHRDLREFINERLAQDGPAPATLPTQVEAYVSVLNEKHELVPADDPGLHQFQALVGDHVRTTLRREEWAEVVREEINSALVSARRWATNSLKQSTALVTNLFRGIFDFFLILMLTAFFLIFFPRIRDYIRALIPPSYRPDYQALLTRIDTRLSGAIRGQVIICVVNGILTYPGVFYIGRLFDAPSLSSFAALLSVMAAILSLIPIFGVIISTIPMVLIALTQSIWAAVAVIAWISIIHAIEAYFLNPNILGHSAQMNPIIVVFALVAGKHAGGLVGALLAVPIASVVVAMFGYYRRRMAKIYAAESGVEVPEDNWGD